MWKGALFVVPATGGGPGRGGVAMSSVTGEDVERGLREQTPTDFYEQILESAAEGVIVLDRRGRFVYVNSAAARTLGYTPRELVAHDGGAHELLHHSHRDGTPYPRDGCPIFTSIHEAQVVRARASDGEVLWRKDGTPLPVSFVSAPIVQNGDVQGVTVVFADVTEGLQRQDERAALHREAAESEKLAAMGTLVSGLSHEIRTPLAILQNNTFLVRWQIERAARQSPEMAALWERVQARFVEMDEAVGRMDQLVGELRRFSRLDDTEAGPAALEDIVEDAERLFRLAHRGSVPIALDLRETQPVLLDPFKIQQLLMNLMENAADASAAEGGGIRVRTRMDEESGRALLIVEDDGLGIPEEVQDRMFDPLFTTKDQGAGLGLAIVRRIADEHDAVVTCDSAPGRGTRFTVGFPTARYG